MFTVAGLLALTISALVGACSMALTLAAGASWPEAMLSGGAAFFATLGVVPNLIDRKESDK